ncbi:MAG: hypothetical protein ACTSRK_06495 [Promethearchaeota archaeon]
MVDPGKNENGTADIKEMKAKLKAELIKQLKEEIKRDILAEIYQELKEESKTPEIKGKKHKKSPPSGPILEPIPDSKPTKGTKAESEKVQITVKAFLKMASHAKKYANDKIPKPKWIEVIGLMAGKFEDGNEEGTLIIEDAYPMGHGNAVYAEIKDYANFTRAFNDLRKKGQFICGWYHSHPSYGLFLSGEDMGTQARYQKLWNKSLALVVDPYQIDGSSYGFDIFRANLQTQKWFKVPFSFKDNLDRKVLPDLLEFINPVIDGKALFLEYDYDTVNG